MRGENIMVNGKQLIEIMGKKIILIIITSYANNFGDFSLNYAI